MREKNINFKVIEEDFFNKTEFFKETYAKALGKVPGKDGVVPVLIDNGLILSESEPITWYVAEKFAQEGNSLLPGNHAERFKMRLFIEEFIKKIIALQGKLFGWSKKSEEDKQKLIQEGN